MSHLTAQSQGRFGGEPLAVVVASRPLENVNRQRYVQCGLGGLIGAMILASRHGVPE